MTLLTLYGHSNFHEGMQECVAEACELSDMFDVTQGTELGCVAASLLFSSFFTMMLLVAFNPFCSNFYICLIFEIQILVKAIILKITHCLNIHHNSLEIFQGWFLYWNSGNKWQYFISHDILVTTTNN